MTGREWTLKEIRDAYHELLKAYDEVFPLHPRERKTVEEAWPDVSGPIPED